MVKVIGDYKPGRVTTTVTDLLVPAPGPFHPDPADLRQPGALDFQRLRVRLDRWASTSSWEVSPSNDGRSPSTASAAPSTSRLRARLRIRLGVVCPQPADRLLPGYTAEPGMYGRSVSEWRVGTDWLELGLRAGLDGEGFQTRTTAMTMRALPTGGYIYTDPYGRSTPSPPTAACNRSRTCKATR